MKYFILATLMALGAAASVRADQDVLFFGKNGPVLIRINIEMDGKPVATVFQDYLKKWLDQMDRDGDGKLNANELKYMPQPNYAQSMFRYGYNYYTPGGGLGLAQMGKGPNDLVTVLDLVEFYQKSNISAVQPAMNYGGGYYAGGGGFVPGGANPKKSPASELLLKKLDTDGDGKLSKQEMTKAFSSLLKFDLNDDEMLTTTELTGNNLNPYYGNVPVKVPGGLPGVPNVNAGSPFYLLSAGNVQAQMPAMILSRYDKNSDYKLDFAESGLERAVFERMDTDQNGSLALGEITGWARFVKPVPVTVRLGKLAAKQESVEMGMAPGKMPPDVTVAKNDQGKIYLEFGAARLTFHGLASNPQMMMSGVGMANFFLQQFKNASQNKGVVELKDLNNNQYLQLKSMFPVIDKNGDDKMTETELENFMALQNGAKDSYASVSLTEEGQDVFQLLDANRDGRLSPREMIYGWSALSVLDRNKDNIISPDEFGQQYVATVARGQMNNVIYYNPNGGIANPLMAPVPNKAGKTGPVWFQKMDVTGDGDLTQREFLGTRDQFAKLDTNNDGLIEADEAERAADLLGKKGN